MLILLVTQVTNFVEHWQNDETEEHFNVSDLQTEGKPKFGLGDCIMKTKGKKIKGVCVETSCKMSDKGKSTPARQSLPVPVHQINTQN